jgi:hypothetical protein
MQKGDWNFFAGAVRETEIGEFEGGEDGANSG